MAAMVDEKKFHADFSDLVHLPFRYFPLVWSILRSPRDFFRQDNPSGRLLPGVFFLFNVFLSKCLASLIASPLPITPSITAVSILILQYAGGCAIFIGLLRLYARGLTANRAFTTVCYASAVFLPRGVLDGVLGLIFPIIQAKIVPGISSAHAPGIVSFVSIPHPPSSSYPGLLLFAACSIWWAWLVALGIRSDKTKNTWLKVGCAFCTYLLILASIVLTASLLNLYRSRRAGATYAQFKSALEQDPPNCSAMMTASTELLQSPFVPSYGQYILIVGEVLGEVGLWEPESVRYPPVKNALQLLRQRKVKDAHTILSKYLEGRVRDRKDPKRPVFEHFKAQLDVAEAVYGLADYTEAPSQVKLYSVGLDDIPISLFP